MVGTGFTFAAVQVGIFAMIASALGLDVIASVLTLIFILLGLLVPVMFLVSLIFGFPRRS
jgi:hypothetical protein